MDKTCAQCGKPFTPNPKKPDQRFCTRECWRLSLYRQVERVCETCGEPFSVHQARAGARFCSLACRTRKIGCVCSYCGEVFYEKASRAGKRLTCSRSCLALLRGSEGRSPRQGQRQSDEARARVSAGLRRYFADNPANHWNYQGGAVVRRGQSWPIQRALARLRDGYACVICDIPETALGKELSVHHRIPFRRFSTAAEANHLDNLISLCQSCHMKAEHGKIALPSLDDAERA